MDELIPYIIKHPSHDPVDVSDVSYRYDYVCSYCSKTDDNMTEPCELNPWWMVMI